MPISVIMVVPLGMLGALAAATAFGMSNDVYFQVGLLTTIGLSAKNAILIVEFARELHAQGRSAIDAADRGCASAAAADRDDLAGLRPRRAAARHRERRRLGQRERGRHRRDRRHADRDLPRPVPDSDVLRGDQPRRCSEKAAPNRHRRHAPGAGAASPERHEPTSRRASVRRSASPGRDRGARGARRRLLAPAGVRAARLAGRARVSDRRCVQVIDGRLGRHDAAGGRHRLARLPDRSAAPAARRDRAREQSRPARRGAECCGDAGAVPHPAAALFPQVGGFANSAAFAYAAQVFRPAAKRNPRRTGRRACPRRGRSTSSAACRASPTQALQQYFASAQARKAAEILLVSEVADQYLTVLADDDLLAVTERTLETARASYNFVMLQFETGTGTELDLRQAETIVEQAKANYAAQVRRARRTRTRWCCCSASRCPRICPPWSAGRAADPHRHPGRAALGPADAPAGRPAGRGNAARGERQHRRRARSVLSAHQPDRQCGHGELVALRAVQGRVTGVGVHAVDHRADLRGGRAQANLDVARMQKDINDRAVREDDPDGVQRGGRRPRGARYVRRRGGVAGTLHGDPAAPARALARCASGTAWTTTSTC